jgi:hypothetical protein
MVAMPTYFAATSRTLSSFVLIVNWFVFLSFQPTVLAHLCHDRQIVRFAIKARDGLAIFEQDHGWAFLISLMILGKDSAPFSSLLITAFKSRTTAFNFGTL